MEPEERNAGRPARQIHTDIHKAIAQAREKSQRRHDKRRGGEIDEKDDLHKGRAKSEGEKLPLLGGSDSAKRQGLVITSAGENPLR